MVRALLATVMVVLAVGCATPVPVAETTRMSHPDAWVAVVPRTVRASPQFARLVAARQADYTVEVVEYDAESGMPAQRLALVRSVLQRLGANSDGVAGYVLLVGGPTALPMGPWKFEGVPEPILTDFPLGSDLDVETEEIPGTEWHAALEREPKWLVGRIPYDEPERAIGMIELGLRQMTASTETRGTALLGADGIGQAWLLASSRNALQEMNWRATLLGASGSCDAPAPGGILPPWDVDAPHLAVLAGRSMDSDEGDGIAELLPGACARDPAPSTPPALLVAFASGFGDPANRAADSLIARGWVAGGVAFTGRVDATPLTAAWRMAVLLPADLASGAPLGNSLEASRRRYWADAGRDIGILLPGASEWRSRNSLSAVVLGDPALRAIANTAIPTTAHAGTATLPIEVAQPQQEPVPPDSPHTNSTAPAADAPPSTLAQTPETSVNYWPRGIAAAALAVFLATVLLWVLARRSEKQRSVR